MRWVWFLGIALTIGALGLRLIVLRGLDVPRPLERRIAVAAGLGAVVALHAGIAAFSLRAEDALQLPFGRFLYGDLSPMAQTRFGEAFVTMTLVFALVLALVYLLVAARPRRAARARVRARRGVRRRALASPGTTRSTRARRGRRRSPTGCTSPPRRSGSAALATMALLLWTGAPELRRVAFLRFSRLATVLIALVLGAGVVPRDRPAAAPARPLVDRATAACCS